MWQAFVTIYTLLQRLYSYRVVYNVETRWFQCSQQIKLSFGIFTAQMVHIWLICTQRMLFYANNIPISFKYSVTDFVVDMISWAMLTEASVLFWVLHTKGLEISQLLHCCQSWGNELTKGKKLNIFLNVRTH